MGAAMENASDGVAMGVEVEEGCTAIMPEEALDSGAMSEDPPYGPMDCLTATATDFLGGPDSQEAEDRCLHLHLCQCLGWAIVK